MVICYLLEEGIGGIFCKAAGVDVEYIEGIDITACMSEEHGECDIAKVLQQNNGQIIIRLKVPD